MTVKIQNWGNSAGIRLSKSLLEMAGLKVGDTLSVEAEEGMILLKRRSLESRFRDYNGGYVPAEYDWEATERR